MAAAPWVLGSLLLGTDCAGAWPGSGAALGWRWGSWACWPRCFSPLCGWRGRLLSEAWLAAVSPSWCLSQNCTLDFSCSAPLPPPGVLGERGQRAGFLPMEVLGSATQASVSFSVTRGGLPGAPAGSWASGSRCL